MGPERREALIAEYKEVCQNFRLLTDIRFRLLTLVPAAAAIVAVVKSDVATLDRLPVALLGLFTTLGIATYNKRNDQLYDTLVGRAAAIERSLGLQDGGFATRPNPWFQYRMLGSTWEVDHRRGVATIYFVTTVLWLYFVLTAILQSHLWAAAVGAVLIVYLGARIARQQEHCRRQQLRNDAIAALEMLNRRERELRQDGYGPGAPEKSLDQVILATLGEDRAFLDAGARMLGSKGEIDKVRARVSFYSDISADALRHYVPDVRGVWRNAFLLALIVDLPPLWLVDVWANRRGASSTVRRGRPVLTPEEL